MPEPRAQRTLVKSPPEIWAEISDVGTLARHLGEFGEIRITEAKAETTVVWEGDTARGTVRLEPSGWGTRVTITAEAIAPEPIAEAAPEPEPEAAEPEPVADAEPIAEAEAVVETPEPVADAEPEPTPEAPTPEPVAATPAPAPRRRGLFARLFGRRPAPTPEPEPAAEHPTSVAPPATAPSPTADVAEPPTAAAPPAEAEETPTADASPAPADAAPPVTEPVLDGEIVVSAGMDPERIEAVLVGVLDDLGSAHHRPFSRG